MLIDSNPHRDLAYGNFRAEAMASPLKFGCEAISVPSSQFLLTAGGRICCVRCNAMSKRTRLQCARPALKISRTGKYQFHGQSTELKRCELEYVISY